MRIPKGVDASPYQLTEPRELVLRVIATEAGVVRDGRPVNQPLPLRPREIDEAQQWLAANGYLETPQVLKHSQTLTGRGLQVAAHLSRMDRHDPITEEAAVSDPLQGGNLTRGTRVRCSCGWGGHRGEQGPAELRVPTAPGQGGRQAAERLHAPHVRQALGQPEPVAKPRRDPFAGLPTADDEPW